jgi:AbrB family looped-hinge helix DNA binding protein
MPLVKIKGNFQVTIPSSIRKKLGIAVGDYVKVEENKKGILIKPVRIVESGEIGFDTQLLDEDPEEKHTADHR